MSGGPPLPLMLYAGATRLIEPWLPNLLEDRVRRGKEDPQRLGERLGRASIARPAVLLAWLHGASVGESLSLLPLVDAIGAARPDVQVLVTSGTRTSAELLSQRLPSGVIHQYAPVDAPSAVARFLDHWRPDLTVLVESELWPNLLRQTRQRGAPMALLSAKLSDASFRNWSRFPRSARALLGGFDLVLAQDARAAVRLGALGAEVAGLADLKFGAASLPADPEVLQTLRLQVGERPLFLAASTHAGEDEILLDAFATIPGAPILVMVPRHPERGPAIADLARSRAFSTSLRSAGDVLGSQQVHVADTLGELGLWFRLARLAVIGGSFVSDVGGHNPLEPARLSCPFASGPHVANWATAYAELAEAGAGERVADSEALIQLMRAAARNEPALTDRAAKARAYVEGRDTEARAVPARVLELLP